jgi:hypothetical protein
MTPTRDDVRPLDLPVSMPLVAGWSLRLLWQWLRSGSVSRFYAFSDGPVIALGETRVRRLLPIMVSMPFVTGLSLHRAVPEHRRQGRLVSMPLVITLTRLRRNESADTLGGGLVITPERLSGTAVHQGMVSMPLVAGWSLQLPKCLA